MELELQLIPNQRRFVESGADETLYGGAAGGGKSYVQIIDALLYALRYPGSKQLVLRRTFPELKRSLIMTSLELYPRQVGRYNVANHVWTFVNGSRIEFGHLKAESDVTQYMSAEYDVIRFDELTHFTEYMYTYLLSRVRGANPFPKQVKSSTNPGSVGHAWVKARFIDLGPPGVVHKTESGSRVFIEARVQDNVFLMESDPGYLMRLKNLPEDTRRALLDGDWDVFEGQYFTEFRREQHVIDPFSIPAHWRRYLTLDYGLDMLACYWIAVDERERAYVYRELYEPNLIIPEAARRIRDETPHGEELYARYAPADLWNRRQDTGKSVAEIFGESGLWLTQVRNGRVAGWYELKRRLTPAPDEFGGKTPMLRIFKTCTELIRTLPSLQHDKTFPNDVAKEPHELTHAPDALRYFCDGRPMAAEAPREYDENEADYEGEIGGLLGYGG